MDFWILEFFSCHSIEEKAQFIVEKQDKMKISPFKIKQLNPPQELILKEFLNYNSKNCCTTSQLKTIYISHTGFLSPDSISATT